MKIFRYILYHIAKAFGVVTVKSFKDPFFRLQAYKTLIKRIENYIKSPNNKTYPYMCITLIEEYNLFSSKLEPLEDLLIELVPPESKYTETVWFMTNDEGCKQRIEVLKHAIKVLKEKYNLVEIP